MEEILNKKIADELMKIKGETRGFNIADDGNFVLREKGPEALAKVEKEMEMVGYPLKYKELKKMDFYPVGLLGISLLAIKKTLAFNDEEIRKMSASLPQIALIIKFFMHYFFSIERALNQASKIWKEYWTVGELTVTECNLKENYAILEIHHFDLHPIFCRAMEGYLEGLVNLITGRKKIVCREKKCTFLGDSTHQFLLKW